MSFSAEANGVFAHLRMMGNKLRVLGNYPLRSDTLPQVSCVFSGDRGQRICSRIETRRITGHIHWRHRARERHWTSSLHAADLIKFLFER